MRKQRKRKTPPPFALGRMLRLCRVSKKQLAERTGIALPMMYRLSSGRANPNWATVLCLAKALNCMPSDFARRATR